MNSKTPKFDKLLDNLLLNLVPHARLCKQKDISKYCEKEFEITEEDIVFYKMLRVPPPACCLTCRRQARFAFVNPSYFYKRKNDAPTGKDYVIGYIPPNSPFTVYDYDYYTNGEWDALSYGYDYELTESFFKQFYKLRLVVPQPALVTDPTNVNYEYSLNGKNSKNVWCSSGIFKSEDIWFSVFTNKSREVMDSHRAFHVENSYCVFYTEYSNNCMYTYFSKQCIDSQFMYDCRNCQDCTGCVNLRNKRYCFFNEQLSKDEYKQKVKDLNLYTRSGTLLLKEKFWNFVKANPVNASRSNRIVDSSGVLLTDVKNCSHCLSVENSENERYVESSISHKDSMDVLASGKSELLYQTTGSGANCSNSKFLVVSKMIMNSEYLINCRNCQYCFGCIALENKSYCIFNKQYTSEEYFLKLDEIKSSLFNNGEYGEFFPYKFSPFAYNGSNASYMYPLEKEDIQKLAGFYQEDVPVDTTGLDLIASKDLPDSIHDVNDDILDKAIICSQTSKPFRITKSELGFYRKNKIPLPYITPYARIKNMFQHMGNHLVYNDKCVSCGIDVESIYIPNTGWKTYCTLCFQKEVI